MDVITPPTTPAMDARLLDYYEVQWRAKLEELRYLQRVLLENDRIKYPKIIGSKSQRDLRNR